MLESMRTRWQLRRLIDSWRQYHEVAIGALAGEPVAPEQEEHFLKLKARLATQLQSLRERLPSSMAEEARREIGAMTELLKHHRTLRHEDPEDPLNREKFEQIWHEHYIFLNKLKGAKISSAPKPVSRSPRRVPNGTTKNWLPKKLAPRRVMRTVITLAVIVVAVYVLGGGLGVHRNGDGKLIIETPRSFQGALSNVLGSLQTLWAGMLRFLTPVTAVYGPTWTILLVGLLLLAVAYWVFVRG